MVGWIRFESAKTTWEQENQREQQNGQTSIHVSMTEWGEH